MNLLLASGRDAAPGPRWNRDAALVRALVAAGCDVTWVVPRSKESEGAFPDTGGARVEFVATEVPGFAAVQDRLLDHVVDQRLMEIVRPALPDVVHILDYGATTSVNSTWAVNRLGARCVVDVDVPGTLCHRGDLLYQGKEPCTNWLDAARCTRCSIAAAPGGLGAFASLVGRVLTSVRSPINPYPTEMDFLNRMDLLIGGLQFVDGIFVPTAEAGEQLCTLGVRDELVVTMPPRAEDDVDPEPYLAQYRRLAAPASGDEPQLAEG